MYDVSFIILFHKFKVLVIIYNELFLICIFFKLNCVFEWYKEYVAIILEPFQLLSCMYNYK